MKRQFLIARASFLKAKASYSGLKVWRGPCVWRAFLLTMIGTAAFPTSTLAADYRTQLKVTSGADYDSNRILNGSTGQDVSRFTMNPVWTNRFTNERMVLDLETGATVVRSQNDDVEDDRIDLQGGLNFSYQYPVSTLTVSAEATRDSLLENQFQDAGVVGSDGTRLRLNGSAGWNRQLGQYTSLVLDISVQNQQFNGDSTSQDFLGGVLVDFTSYGANVGINRQLSPRWSVGAFIGGQQQDTSNASVGNTTSGSVFFSTNYRITEYWTLDGQGGVTRIDNNFIQTTSWTSSLGLTYDFERWTLSTSAQRDFLPSANGTSRKTLSATVSAKYAFTSRLSVGADGSFRRSQLLGIQNLNDRQIQASSYLNWRFSRNLGVNVDYRFRDQQLVDGVVGGFGNGSGHRVGVRLEFFYPPSGLEQ